MRMSPVGARVIRLCAVAVGLTALWLLLAVPALAQEEAKEGFDLISEETEKLIESMDLTQIEQTLPEVNIRQWLSEAAKGESGWDAQALWATVRQSALSHTEGLYREMLRILGISVLCAALTKLRCVTQRDGVASLCEMLVCLCLLLPLIQNLSALIAKGTQTAVRMTDVYHAVLPTLLALLTSVGGVRSAALMEQLSLAATGVLTGFVQKTLFPALSAAACVACVAEMNAGIPLKKTFRLMRSGIHWALGLCFTVFWGLLTIQSSTAANYDGVAMKAAKFAVEKFVPVVGGVFKDTANTLAGCSLVVKNALGVVGLVGIFLIVLEPGVQILCTAAAYRICAALLEPFGTLRMSAALCDFADILVTLFILILSVGAMCFVFLATAMQMGMELIR